jgi:hypothetical protein
LIKASPNLSNPCNAHNFIAAGAAAINDQFAGFEKLTR